jgi:hypothetical protein
LFFSGVGRSKRWQRWHRWLQATHQAGDFSRIAASVANSRLVLRWASGLHFQWPWLKDLGVKKSGKSAQ